MKCGEGEIVMINRGRVASEHRDKSIRQLMNSEYKAASYCLGKWYSVHNTIPIINLLSNLVWGSLDYVERGAGTLLGLGDKEAMDQHRLHSPLQAVVASYDA